MFCRVFIGGLKGQNNVAQGNALGTINQITQALKGRNKWAIRNLTLFRPYRAKIHLRPRTQGVALGYHVSPRWGTYGFGLLNPDISSDAVGGLTGQDNIAQGNALGTINQITQALKGRNKRCTRDSTVLRPYRAKFHIRTGSQGVALGYYVLPRWGIWGDDALRAMTHQSQTYRSSNSILWRWNNARSSS